MNTRTGFVLLISSIIIVPLLVIAVILPLMFDVRRPKNILPEFQNSAQLIKYLNRLQATNDSRLINAEFMFIEDGKIAASNIDGYEIGQPANFELLSIYLLSEGEPGATKIIRRLPGFGEGGTILISLPVTITNYLFGDNEALQLVPAALLILMLLTATGISLLILRGLNSKLKKMAAAADAISAGNLDYSLNFDGNDIFSSFARNFDSMRLALKEEKQRESRFIMGISHDLKTPLTLIGGYAEAIADDTDGTAEKENYLSIIKIKIRDLEHKINTLIDYRRMETGEWRKSLEEVNLHKLLTEISTVIREDSIFMDIYFRSDINIPRNYTTKLDQSLFSRAVENVTSNSIRYTEKGGSICLAAFIRDGKAVLEITDTGKGIETEELAKVTEPFFRASKSRRGTGFGLGLSIVKNIAESHGWTFSIESEPGFGTKITLSGV